jgi:hypothetical protein
MAQRRIGLDGDCQSSLRRLLRNSDGQYALAAAGIHPFAIDGVREHKAAMKTAHVRARGGAPVPPHSACVPPVVDHRKG